MQNLPVPPPSFAKKKLKILAQLSVPEGEYTDSSPKGSVDDGIRPLVDAINRRDGLVTTSSCAGRVSVYLEGKKTEKPLGDDAPVWNRQEGADDANAVRASTGGKGGGEWLFVSHSSIPHEDRGEDWASTTLGLVADGKVEPHTGRGHQRLIHFKFEPMILHIFTASNAHAQLVLQAGLEAGFRESGALLGKDGTPMVGIRSMGLSFESLIGIEDISGVRRCIVSPAYLDMVVKLANERFVENSSRIARLQAALNRAFGPTLARLDWEDADLRQARKREEGLRRALLKKENSTTQTRHQDALADPDALLLDGELF